MITKKKELEFRQLFKTETDCYADTGSYMNDGSYVEGDVIQAMTEDVFIKVLSKILESEIKKIKDECKESLPSYSSI
jgi:hypothetical protein